MSATTTTTTTTTAVEIVENKQSLMEEFKQKAISKSSFNSSDLNEISVCASREELENGLKHLPQWPPVNIEFEDLNFSVPDLTGGRKSILRNISGKFRSNEITALMGPSGSGKTTLLNILAGYKISESSGQILVNDKPRKLREFRKMSRYIMQHEIIDPNFTIREMMTFSANLKLGNSLTIEQKNEVIDEILNTLRLRNAQNTRGFKLSGGERKRLTIALELVNNPPIIFLDEPTTGLDDISSNQCITLLRRIAHSGRTVVCSIHTPSAKLFEMMDHVYVLASGQCVYQGTVPYIIPFLKSIDLICPLTYNPADFIIEVASGEYGIEYQDKMVQAVDNGQYHSWTPYDFEINPNHSKETLIEQFHEEINPKLLKSKSTKWQQFKILFRRMMIQSWRDKSYLRLRFVMNIILGFIVGGTYHGIGNDASRSLFNFGFAFTIPIAYLYLPMMPVLLQFPIEVRLLKREYFNQWYNFSSYYFAMTLSKLPIMIFLAVIYLGMIYFISSQPLEIYRFLQLFLISILIGMTSDSLGVLVASRLNMVNSMFAGPVVSVPLILFSVYGFGYNRETYIPPLFRFCMYCSYLRFGLQGILASLYNDRADMVCPDGEMICYFKQPALLLEFIGFSDPNYLISLIALIGYYILFTILGFILIKRRLSFTTSKNKAIQYISQIVKTHLNFATSKY